MATDATQLELALIPHEEQGNLINQRLMDGYINATALCQASNKLMGHYLELASTKAFLQELSSDIGIPISELVQVIKGGNPQFQGTWVHPQVAIHLGQWASPKFAVLVSKWVFDWMSGNIPNKSRLPYHIQRYLLNKEQIPATHFSVFDEVILGLIGPLEQQGYLLPDNMVPDISQGKIFAKWVREEKGMEPNDFPTYTHTYPDGRRIRGAKLYPNSLLADFRTHFNNVWLRERAIPYFADKDATCMPFLEKIVNSLPQPEEFTKKEIPKVVFNESLAQTLKKPPK